MMRNDYRRALILLRGNAQGYSGHVRLERRTLMGSMYFLLQAPPECGGLHAYLAGRDKSGYYACELGELNRDSRGQAVLTYNFDPRNICGRELESYQLIAVACISEASCETVLWGNVAGHAEMNMDKVREALCALHGSAVAQDNPAEEPAAQLPAPEEMMPEEAPMPAAVQPKPVQAEPSIEPSIEHSIEPVPENTIQTAGQLLDINMELPWPETIEPLRPLFAVSVPMENPPDEQYIYIAVAMPEGSAYAYCAVGVLAEEGAPVSVRYGLPAAWTAQAPAGLEDYAWVGDQNRGWWMTQVDLPTCGRI